MSLTESPQLAGAALANVANSSWTKAREAELIRLWEVEKLSASQVAVALGGITRNAVIAKTHRLKLERRGPRSGILVAKKTRAKTPSRITAAHLNKCRAEALQGPPVPLPPEAELSVPSGQRCTLLELDDSKCHWPHGEPGTPDFFFCGGKKPEGTPYCGYHCSVAYQPPAARQDKRPSRV